MNKKKMFRIFSLISIIFLCIGLTTKCFQNDTFYMLKIGDYIFQYGIDFKDHWCWIADLSYTYPHWLYSIYIYVIYYNFGYKLSLIKLFIYFK